MASLEGWPRATVPAAILRGAQESALHLRMTRCTCAPHDRSSVHPKAAMTVPAHIRRRHACRRAAGRRTAPRQTAGDAGAGGDVCDLHCGEGAAADPPGVRLRRGLCGSRHHRRSCRLVCRGRLVSQAFGAADPAHRDHPEQPAPHRRQARRIHRGAFSRSGPGRGKTAPDRFRRVHRRLAARPQAQRGSRALCVAAVARSGCGHGEFRPDDLRQPPHHRAIDVDRSGAARRRHAAHLREGRPAPGPARRHPARGASIADAGRDHGHDPREDPRRIADTAKTLSRRPVPGEQDRGVGDRVLRGSAQRSQASVPRRVRPHGADLRRPARQRSGLCRAHRGAEARSAGAPRTEQTSRATSGRMRARSSSAARQARRRCCSNISCACS